MNCKRLRLWLLLVPLGGCAAPGFNAASQAPALAPKSLSCTPANASQSAAEDPSAAQQPADVMNGVALAGFQQPPADGESSHENGTSHVELAAPPALSPARSAAEPEPAGGGGPQSSVAEAAVQQLSLAELESLALANNPALVEMRARIEALRGRWVQAGLAPNPVAQYQAEEIGSEDAAGLHSLGIGQTVVTADKLRLAQAVIASEIRRAEANLAADQLRVQTDVATAFTAALVAQRRLELVEQLRRIAAESVDSINQLLLAAEVSRAPLLQARTELQQAELAVETSRAALAGARRQLASVSGLAELPPLPLGGDLSESLPEVPYETALAELLAASPQLADRAAALERAQRSLRLACAQGIPNVTGQVSVGYDAGTEDPFTSVQISVPLPVNNRNQGNVRRARAEITAAGHALQRAELNLANQLAATLQRYQTARVRALRLEEQIVPNAEEALELSRQAFEVGETGYQQLLTAQRTLFQVRLDTLAAIEEARQAAALIDGFLLQGSLQPTQFEPNLEFLDSP